MNDHARPPWHGAAVDMVAILGLVALACAHVLDGTAAAGWIAAVVAGRLSASVFRGPPNPPPPAAPAGSSARPPSSGVLTLALGVLLAVRAGAGSLCRALQA